MLVVNLVRGQQIGLRSSPPEGIQGHLGNAHTGGVDVNVSLISLVGVVSFHGVILSV
jgi:hypothetical protein